MKLGVRTSVLLLALLPTTITALLLGLYQIHSRMQDLLRVHQQQGQALAQHLATTAEYPLLANNDRNLRQLVLATLQEADVVDVVIYNGLGETRMHGRRQANGALRIGPDIARQARTGSVFEAAIVRTALDVEGDAFDFPETVTPTDAQRITLGSARVELTRERMGRRQQEALLSTLLLLLVCLLGAAFAGWRLERTITGPIVALGETVAKLREGDLGARMEEHSTAELGALESGINAMATALQTSRDTLQQQVADATRSLTQALATLERQNAEREAARQQAEQASLSKSEFLATMSHEIRTPLHGVSGFLRLLARTPLSLRQQEYVRLLTASADNLLKIINGVLDFVKMEAHQLELHAEPCHLPDLLECAVYLYTATARNKGLRLILFIRPEVPSRVIVDRQRLSQVIANLVSNAVKFTDQGSVNVHVSTLAQETEQATVRIVVSDTGPGIAPEAQAQIFQAFQQLDTSRTRRQEGTGLGLAICQHLVALLGGQLTLDSEPGAGSRFIVTLPLRLPLEANVEPVISNSRFRQHGAEEPGSSSYPFASRRVLIVDDNRINRRLARSILDAFTLRIDEATQGEEAIDACQSTRYDLILMDIRMPGMDGMAVTRHLRQTAGGLNQSTPIIGLTADLLREDRDLILSAGMNDCLYKPLSPDALEAIFQHWVAADSTS